MVAFLDDPAVLEDDDAVGVLDGGEAVRDHDGRAAVQHDVEAFLDLRLGERIDAGGGLVEDDDGRVLHQHAREGDQLALAHRQRLAVLADLGVADPFGQGLDPVAAADLVARRAGPRPSAGVGPRIADVVGDRAGEQERRLRHDAELPPIAWQVERADVAAVRSGSGRPGTRRSG